MNFLHPEVLYALFALAVPVLIHLFSFRKYKRVAFSNVQFLKDVKEQQASYAHLKERLILAARLLSLLFLILAFAKPYFSSGQTALAGKQQIVSIFVDNSYSMQTLNRDGSLLDEAKRRAKEIVSAYQLNDRFQLLTQDFEGRHQRLLTADEFNNAVDTIQLTAQSRTLQQIINRQQSLLSSQQQAVKSIYVISDFQRNLIARPALKLDSGERLAFIRIKASALPNIAVDSVIMINAAHRAGQGEKVVVRLHNYADKDAQAIPLKIIINGVQKALGSFSVKANAVQNDTLSFSGLQPGWQSAEVQLQDNPITFDNRFYFTFDVQRQLPVLLINGSLPDRYLNAAYKTDPFFNLQQVSSTNVNYAALSQYPVCILSNIHAVAKGLAQQLKSYVTSGGTLMVFPADDADLASYKALLQPIGAVWPARLINEPAKVSALNLNSAVLKGIFEELPHNPDLPVAGKHYQLSAVGNNNSSTIMQLPGQESFLAGYASGKGNVYVSAVPLDESYSNLPRHGLLLPLLFRISLLSIHQTQLYYTIGQDEQVTIPPLQLTEKQLLHVTKGNQSFIPDVQQRNGSNSLFVADQVKQAGIYHLKLRDSLVSEIAFNNSRSESDLHYAGSNALQALSAKNIQMIEPGTAPVKNTIAEANNGLQLWKVCLILALIFIAAEILLIRLLKPSGTRVKSAASN